MNKKNLADKIGHLINVGNSFYDNLVYNEPTSFGYVKTSDFAGFKAMGLSFIANLYGEDHSYFSEFKKTTNNNWSYDLDGAISILKAIDFEIQNGWLDNLRKLVSAELFSDFMEMSKYLLDEGYKDASAVMLGSILEENLRCLCKDNNIQISMEKNGKSFSKKANLLNDELYKENIYNALTHKSILSWLELRNNAAHGHYENYSIANVQFMYQGILNFLSIT